MANFTDNKSKSTKFSNVNANEFLELESNAGTPDESGRYFIYVASDVPYFWNGSSSQSLLGGGGGVTGSLDSAYSIGSNVSVDEGASTWTDATAGALNTFELVKTGAGSGNMLDCSVDAVLTGAAIGIDMNLGIAAEAIYIDAGAGARTGSDILVKADSTGNHSVIDINESGSGNTICLDIAQAGSGNVIGVKYVGSHNSTAAGNALYVDLNDGDCTACVPIYIAMGTGTRNVATMQIVSTHTGSGALIDLSMDGNCTGDGITIDMNAAIDAKAIYIDGGAGTRTDDLIGIKYDGDGNTDVLSIVATNTGTGAILDINMDGLDTGEVMNVDMNVAVGAEFLRLDAGGGTRTVNLFEIINDGDGNVDLVSIVSSNTGTGAILDLNMDGIDTGEVLNVDMNAAVGAEFLKLDAGGGTRTVDLIDVTFDGDGNVGYLDITVTNTGSGNIIEVDCDGIHTGDLVALSYGTAAATGNAISIAQGTNVAGSALTITAAGARVDDLIKIDDSSTSNSPMFDINFTGAHTGGCFDVHFDHASQTGAVLNVDMDGALGAQVFTLDAGGGTRTVDMVEVTFDGDGDVGYLDITCTNTGSGNIIEVDVDGIHTGNLIALSYGTSAATGDAINLTMGTNVAGRALVIGSAATGVSGEGAAIDITHTGDLAAGADVVNITSSGNLSATSNLLAIEHATGACTAGAYGLYINVTGENIEAIKVDAGNVVLDEDLRVGGTTTLTGAVTATLGVQNTATARTATADGTDTGAIASGTSHVTVTSDSANKIITLPAPVVGNVIRMYVGTTGFELRTVAASNVKINDVDSDGTNECAIPATSLVKAVCVSNTEWIVTAVDELGAVISALVPDAA